jgi:iron(III) transport system ATP-binding protein
VSASTSLLVEGVTKSFGENQVLRGVDLVVPGGVTSVLGASGDGKTTLLRIIAGFLRADAGKVTIGARVVVDRDVDVPPQRRRVGYVPQEGALFPHLDVAGNIGFGLPGRGGGARGRARLAEMLDLVELPAAVASTYPHELSGGQQQRVALARALAPAPAVVLLDEPFSSLDASLREGTGRAVRHALSASSTTAVMVTHDQDEALSLSDQVAVMRDGRLVQVAGPVDVYRRPVDPAVAVFMGGASVLPAAVSGGSAECALGRVVVADPGPALGARVVVVRPEQIVLAADGTPGVTATVTDVSYYGHDATMRLRVGDQGPLVVARISHGAVPVPGDVVRVRVDGPVLAFA